MKIPESNLLEVVMRVREIAKLAYNWWLFCFSAIYLGLLAPPLIILTLATSSAVPKVPVVALCIVMTVCVALLFLLDPRSRFARVEAAFNDLAWTSRIDLVSGPVDAAMVRQVRKRLHHAVRLIDSKDAAALLPIIDEAAEPV